MGKVIYATDLDRTVIFSERFVTEQHPVSLDKLSVSEETSSMRSYVLNEYIDKLKYLLDNRDIKFIPVTSRSIAEYKRVKLAEFSDYAIVTNGCHILFKGKIYEPYERFVKENLINFENFQKNAIMAVMGITKLEKEPKIIDDAYVFAKVNDPNEDTSKQLKEFNTSNEDILIERNGRKLYATPKNINKGTALMWLINHLKVNRINTEKNNEDNIKIIASGDSIMDASFIKYADVKIVPQHGDILKEHLDFLNDSIVVSNGPIGALETLAICEDYSD